MRRACGTTLSAVVVCWLPGRTSEEASSRLRPNVDCDYNHLDTCGGYHDSDDLEVICQMVNDRHDDQGVRVKDSVRADLAVVVVA